MVETLRYNYLFMDYCHPTPVGYYIIAESLYEYCIEHNFFKRSEGEILKPSNIRKITSSKNMTITDLTN